MFHNAHTEEEFDDFDVPPFKIESTWKGWCGFSVHVSNIHVSIAAVYTHVPYACTALEIEDKFEEFGLAAVKTEVKCEGQCMCGYPYHTFMHRLCFTHMYTACS